ncbi:hypothetical protein [Candidatus Coxiella mudrowiae]|uniref:hypothetical protein n=1 Tax=Candidatus Coxiella mudrowiae TaxID=2054173 RepID=UPI00138DD23D|nr:hypothetical protein [Candidatus Coxiella mudrowiae]
MTFYVSVYGYLESVKANDAKMETLHQLNQIIGHKQAMPSTDGLNIKYYPSSALNGNSGKIAEVGGVSPSVIIHALQLTVLFLAFNFKYYGNKIPFNNGPSPLTINPRFQSDCPSISGNEGKVRRIGRYYLQLLSSISFFL